MLCNSDECGRHLRGSFWTQLYFRNNLCPDTFYIAETCVKCINDNVMSTYICVSPCWMMQIL